jgi:GAF domain-containing protein
MSDSVPQPSLGADPRLERLVVATSALITELSLDGVLQRVVQVAAEVIGAHYAAIGVLAPDGRVLESFTTYGISDEVRERIGPPPRGHGILGLVIREARPIRLPDLTRHPDSYGFPPHHPPMHSFLGVPIVSRRGVFGNLYLTEKIDAQVFSEGDEHVAVVLAAITAAAVENARLHEESARLLEEVQGLQRTRERFFAMVNHELRNALAAVFGWAEMLVRKKDPATVPRAAFEVLDSARQAIGLINDLLDLSRLDEDRAGGDRPPGDRPRYPRGGGAADPAGAPGVCHAAELRDRRQPAGADPRQPPGQRHPPHSRRERDPGGARRARRHGRVRGGRRRAGSSGE